MSISLLKNDKCETWGLLTGRLTTGMRILPIVASIPISWRLGQPCTTSITVLSVNRRLPLECVSELTLPNMLLMYPYNTPQPFQLLPTRAQNLYIPGVFTRDRYTFHVRTSLDEFRQHFMDQKFTDTGESSMIPFQSTRHELGVANAKDFQGP